MEEEKLEVVEEVTEEETGQVLNLLTQIQEQLVNVQKALDTMAPVTEPEPEPDTEPEPEPESSEPTPEELEEIDKLLNDDY